MPAWIADTFGTSRSEARRVIAQGGVSVDDEILMDFDVPESTVAGRTIRLGRRRSHPFPKARGRAADGYEILIGRLSQPTRYGEWIVRLYTADGEHIHSAEGGVPLEVGLREVERAIHRFEHPVTER